MSSTNNDAMTVYELKYIEIVGRSFGVHGRSEAMGQIYALLNLRARTPDTAMSQQGIANILEISLSTVSRTLKKLFKGGYCSYILEDNKQERAERRYHAKYDYKEFIIARFTQTLSESNLLVNNLTHLRHSIPDGSADRNRQLLEQIDFHIEQTNMASTILEKLRKELLEDAHK